MRVPGRLVGHVRLMSINVFKQIAGGVGMEMESAVRLWACLMQNAYANIPQPFLLCMSRRLLLAYASLVCYASYFLLILARYMVSES